MREADAARRLLEGLEELSPTIEARIESDGGMLAAELYDALVAARGGLRYILAYFEGDACRTSLCVCM